MNSSKKRGCQQGEDTELAGTSRMKRPCNYGKNCYRQNHAHFEEYSHPHLEKLLAEQKGTDIVLPSGLVPSIVLPQLETIRKQKGSDLTPSVQSSLAAPIRGDDSNGNRNVDRTDGPHVNTQHHHSAGTPSESIATKLEAAAPHNFFLCTVTSSKETCVDPKSITFSELLDKSLGDFHSSLQINFMVEMDWLMSQYKIHNLHKKPLVLLYGVGDEILKGKMPPWIIAVKVKPPSAFGHHHTKMSMFYYSDGGLRIVVSTANLIESDWDNRTQGVWVSPLCPKLPADSGTDAGESPTEFKADLLRYLINYNLPQMKEWVTRIQQADCSKINVCFVASVPGTHDSSAFHRWGHLRLRRLLQQHANVPDSDWPLLVQCSSIGSLGADVNAWMGGEWLVSMAKSTRTSTSLPPLKMVYPSFRNVAGSHDGILGGACLPYSMVTHKKQPWLTSYLHLWKSDSRNRTEAMPHIKTYSRVSPQSDKLAWFHLTSANLSKAAWGMLNKHKSALRIMSYEAGVLFLPKFVTKSDEFCLKGDRCFPMPFDLPVTPYGTRDKPWVNEYMQ